MADLPITSDEGAMPVVGSVDSGVTDLGYPVKIGAIYTNPLPVVTSGQRVNIQCDPSGRVYVAPTPNLTVSTFGTNAIFAFAGAATDIFTIRGSATKTIKITQIDIDGGATTTSSNNVVLIKRVTANTGGTFNVLTPTRYDTNTAGGTATVGYYTTNPTVLGTPQGTTGIISAYRVTFLAAAAAATTLVTLDFQKNGAGSIVLNSATESLCINMNGATVAGNSININIEWTEE